MTVELTALTWTVVLAVVQLFLPVGLRNRETGLAYNAGPRDDPAPPPGKVTGRLQRAQANLYETLPLFAIVVLVAHAANRHTYITANAAWIYLVARILYVPAYAFAWTGVRSLLWGAGLAAILLDVFVLLHP
jgi:uncharacterized MAPEG superfamily protein